MINSFLSKEPLSPYIPPNSQICSCCGTEEEYLNFLIGEYGAEKVLEVQQQEKEMEDFYNKMNPLNILICLAALAVK